MRCSWMGPYPQATIARTVPVVRGATKSRMRLATDPTPAALPMDLVDADRSNRCAGALVTALGVAARSTFSRT